LLVIVVIVEPDFSKVLSF